MRVRLGRRSGAAAALLLALLIAGPTSPAGAADGGPTITIDAPKSDSTIGSDTVTVSGSVTTDALLYRLKTVTLMIGSDSKKVDCSESPCPFSWQVKRPLNGPYELKVAATQVAILLGTPGPGSEQVRTFSVAAPAAKPVLDPPTVTDGRTVNLSWARNTEGDMLYYAVFRKDPGASKYLQVGGKVAQPTTGAKVSFIDTTTSGFSGGAYSYQVVAVRKGATGTAASEALSDPSAAAPATVPPPPTTSTAVTVPGTPVTMAPTTTVKPGTSGGIDLSGFLSSRSQPITLPTITVPELPDTGFQNKLPFGARPPGEDVEEGEADAVKPNRSSGNSIVSIDAGRPLVPVAGGLVLLLLALHLRLLGRRVQAPIDGDLPVDLTPRLPVPPTPSPTPSPPAVVVTTRAPAPVPAPFDNDEDWSPRPEPEPHPVTHWVPPGPIEAPSAAAVTPEEIEVFEVVSSNRRPLVRAGSR